MKLLGLGLQLAKRRQSSCASGCHQPYDALPPCPPKPMWTGGRVLVFSMVTFGAGVYTGVYVSQNYEVARVDDPQKLIERMNRKIAELFEGKKK
ncbi:uncharacterized protein LOC6557380 [Drosophila grimshawi]|uniref:GH16774 n=1 Tax=Drosophila grimshawi TaxID=7222 RepID=B4J3R7_DROGR|nr:uncharacterized protein LOC6557380 [Drosophila grimshawi]EDV97298.1 GH16774 [Drosophila grimshawi]